MVLRICWGNIVCALVDPFVGVRLSVSRSKKDKRKGRLVLLNWGVQGERSRLATWSTAYRFRRDLFLLARLFCNSATKEKHRAKKNNLSILLLLPQHLWVDCLTFIYVDLLAEAHSRLMVGFAPLINWLSQPE